MASRSVHPRTVAVLVALAGVHLFSGPSPRAATRPAAGAPPARAAAASERPATADDLAARWLTPDDSATRTLTQDGPAARTFQLEWRVVARVPRGTRRARVWVAIPQQRPEQDVRALRVRAPGRWRIVVDRDFGNRLVRVDVDGPGDSVRVDLSAVVVRRAVLAPQAARLDARARRLALRTTTRVTLSDDARAVVAAVPADAQAIYDWVLDHMTYDKTLPGWGHGDAERACRVGAGNCTDFHSLFMALARARGIPTVFEMGYATRPQGETNREGGYHCWAWFHDGSAWVPVDISEADRHPERAAFYFGHLDADRIAFARGRDVRLAGMQGPPLNFVPVGGYAEFDGHPAPDGAVRRWISYTVE